MADGNTTLTRHSLQSTVHHFPPARSPLMPSFFDLYMDPQHPQRDPLQRQTESLGGTCLLAADGQIPDAITNSASEWIVFVDRRSTVPLADFPGLVDSLPPSTAPIRIQPWSNTSNEDRFVAARCPPVIALCWSALPRLAAVCVRRKLASTLPAMRPQHPEILWDWLLRSASLIEMAQPQRPTSPDLPGSHSADCLPPLIAGAPNSERQWLVDFIHQSKPSLFVPEKCSEADTVAVKAGLLQWHDATAASHQLSQSVEGLGMHQAGDYWHAINHRREPDYSNARYWFRHLGQHPIFADLPAVATQILDHCPDAQDWKTRLVGTGTWNPFAFVDLCEASATEPASPLGMAARQIQAAEMQRLIVSTYQDASARPVSSTS